MISSEGQTIQELEELLKVYRRRLHKLRLRVALQGVDARPEYQIEIENIEEDIQHLEARLRQIANNQVGLTKADKTSLYRIDHPLTNLESTLRYKTLDLRFSHREGNRYEVLLRSDIGDVTDEFDLPFSMEDMLRLRLGVSGKAVRFSRPIFERLKDFGHRLYDSFPPRIRERYQAARDTAPGVRLRLDFTDSQLATIPWELLYDPNRREFCGLSGQSLIVRYAEVGYPPLVQFALPLRLLVAAPNPKDLPPLDIEQEQKQIQNALSELENVGLVTIFWLNFEESKRPVSLESLHDALFSFRPHVLHFIGHGSIDESQDEGILYFEHGKTWESDAVSSWRLAQLVTSSNSLRLVFLNSCHGAACSETEKMSSVAAALAQKGVAATLGMQFPISDSAAVEFAGKFYQRLAEGTPVDTAVQEGRIHLGVVKDNPIEWATPMLYLLPRDGRVFQLMQEANASNGK